MGFYGRLDSYPIGSAVTLNFACKRFISYQWGNVAMLKLNVVVGKFKGIQLMSGLNGETKKQPGC